MLVCMCFEVVFMSCVVVVCLFFMYCFMLFVVLFYVLFMFCLGLFMSCLCGWDLFYEFVHVFGELFYEMFMFVFMIFKLFYESVMLGVHYGLFNFHVFVSLKNSMLYYFSYFLLMFMFVSMG